MDLFLCLIMYFLPLCPLLKSRCIHPRKYQAWSSLISGVCFTPDQDLASNHITHLVLAKGSLFLWASNSQERFAKLQRVSTGSWVLVRNTSLQAFLALALTVPQQSLCCQGWGTREGCMAGNPSVISTWLPAFCSCSWLHVENGKAGLYAFTFTPGVLIFLPEISSSSCFPLVSEKRMLSR